MARVEGWRTGVGGRRRVRRACTQDDAGDVELEGWREGMIYYRPRPRPAIYTDAVMARGPGGPDASATRDLTHILLLPPKRCAHNWRSLYCNRAPTSSEVPPAMKSSWLDPVALAVGPKSARRPGARPTRHRHGAWQRDGGAYQPPALVSPSTLEAPRTARAAQLPRCRPQRRQHLEGRAALEEELLVQGDCGAACQRNSHAAVRTRAVCVWGP